jgi:hypothetical protein
MNSKKNLCMQGFNNEFFSFLDEVIKIYPENREISSAKESFRLVKTANPTAIIKVWYKHIYLPYKDVIESGDIDFFCNKDYVDDLAILANAKEVMSIIDKIREPIKQMEPVNKGHSADYIRLLSKLSVAYNNLS